MKQKPINELVKSDIIKFTEELFSQIKIDYALGNWTEEFLLSFVNLISIENSKLSFSKYSFSDLEIAFKMNAYGGLDKFMGRQNSNISAFKMPNLIKVLWAYKSYSSSGNLLSSKKEETVLNKDIIKKQYLENVIEYYDKWLSGEDVIIRTPFYTASFLKSLGLINEDVTYRPNEMSNLFFQKKGNKVNDYNSRLIYQAFNEIRESGNHISNYFDQNLELPF